MILSDQLDSYIIDMHSSIEFSNLLGIGYLAHKMVETKKTRGISTGLLTSDIGIDLASCDCHSRESIFSYEDCKESIT